MLTDKTMARLAEDCGWTALGSVFINGKQNAIAMAHSLPGGWLLSDAGCWQASKKLLLAQAPLSGGKIWKVILPAGLPALAIADSTPEAALMLAIQEVYA